MSQPFSMSPARSVPIVSSPSNNGRLEYPNVVFFGRTLADYQRFFDLSQGHLSTGSFLDVAAGPASFAAEAARLGCPVTAVDPVYRKNLHGVAATARFDFAETLRKVRANPDAFTYARGVDSIEDMAKRRATAMESFLCDYPTGRAMGRYTFGELPNLPFADRSFDTVLCGHFLFLYANPTFSTQPINRLFSALNRLGRRMVVRGTPSKSAVVKTCPLHNRGFDGKMLCHHVFEMHSAQERWQGTPVLVHCGKPAVCGR